MMRRSSTTRSGRSGGTASRLTVPAVTAVMCRYYRARVAGKRSIRTGSAGTYRIRVCITRSDRNACIFRVFSAASTSCAAESRTGSAVTAFTRAKYIKRSDPRRTEE